MEKLITYKSTGIVLGNYWGGGSGSYASKSFNADSLEELIELNQKAARMAVGDNTDDLSKRLSMIEDKLGLIAQSRRG